MNNFLLKKRKEKKLSTHHLIYILDWTQIQVLRVSGLGFSTFLTFDFHQSF